MGFVVPSWCTIQMTLTDTCKPPCLIDVATTLIPLGILSGTMLTMVEIYRAFDVL